MVIVAGGVGCIPPNGETLDVWTLNVYCENCRFCYLAQEEVRLWLPEEKRLGLKTLVIKTRRPRQKVKLRWPASEETLPWPVEEMPIQSGVPHRIKGKTSSTITLHQIPAEYRTTAEQAQWMEEKGCMQQAEMLRK
ncbi:MAG: hypothetical protein DRR19_12675 [Candidatus Parabeggiatoa sp. nov. 1]|nr:MAG: hypothetical protein DRR19_12675 [Gammaproteobacteria bacterium]